MHVVRQVNLPGQRSGQCNQQASVLHVLPGHPSQVTEHHHQRKNTADRGNAFLGQNGPNLRGQCIPQPLLETHMPQAVVVPVARCDVVPSCVGVCSHAVGGALLLEVRFGDWAAHQVLQAQQNTKHTSVNCGQTGINRDTQHDGIENQTEKQLQVCLKLIDQFKKNLERFVG